MTLTNSKIVEILEKALTEIDLKAIQLNIISIQNSITNNKKETTIEEETQTNVTRKFLLNELTQILETRTIERTKYYIQRLIKAITKVKTSKINDINLHQWKEYDDILTDSLWVLDKRDNSGIHNASYWGNFIPQIPNQFLRRYTKKGDWVLDTFLGSGTTLIESKRLGRNGIGIELNKEVAKATEKNINKEPNELNVQAKVIQGNSLELDYEKELVQLGIKKVQLLMMHPPYWDIIKFSENPNDLSNAKTLESFLEMMRNLAEKTYSILEKDRYCVLVISDKYEGGEWIPLAFYTMQEFLKQGYQLKSTIVKNFDITKAKQSQKELWRYRALVGGFHIFKHEYIFLFKKIKN
jgi:16S rRNA G966 N2-methylase RsmD